MEKEIETLHTFAIISFITSCILFSFIANAMYILCM
jgi:hypothetical protein